MSIEVTLVDDAADLRMLVELALKRDGRFDVVASVGDGQQGLDAIEDHLPDVVLLDISMPRMDGLTALRIIRERHPGLPVVMFTGYGDERLRVEAERAGADAFADKSQPLEQVIDLLVGVIPSETSAPRGD